MSRAAAFLLLWLAACQAPAAARRPAADEPLVDFHSRHPRALLDIRYAGKANFTGKAVYPAARCLLRRAVAGKLEAACREFEALGYRVRVFDCYRPLSVQRKFWELVHDERYVADPAKGSRHNRGAAVDLELDRADGTSLEWPTAYDDFSAKAHRDWSGASAEARKNRELLEKVMGRHGFAGLPTEWWHFDARDWEAYPVADVPFESVP